ncbi:MAG: 50S ribosomal protein L11 [Chlamydiales bacterium]
MAKAKGKVKLEKTIKLQIPAGKANPAPPIGPALGSAGVNIMAFCKEFNAKTQDKQGKILPVVISVYSDKSFDFIMKQPPNAQLIMEKLGIAKGSAVPNRDKVGKITRKQLEEIADEKWQDMNADSKEGAVKILLGTARSMGVDLVEE